MSETDPIAKHTLFLESSVRHLALYSFLDIFLYLLFSLLIVLATTYWNFHPYTY